MVDVGRLDLRYLSAKNRAVPPGTRLGESDMQNATKSVLAFVGGSHVGIHEGCDRLRLDPDGVADFPETIAGDVVSPAPLAPEDHEAAGNKALQIEGGNLVRYLGHLAIGRALHAQPCGRIERRVHDPGIQFALPDLSFERRVKRRGRIQWRIGIQRRSS